MTLIQYQEELLSASSEAQILSFCRNKLIHGTPFVFQNREPDLFAFKERICDHLSVHHTCIFIVGSAKLGFSPVRHTVFSQDSDIDIAIVSPELVQRMDCIIAELQYDIRSSSVSLRPHQSNLYSQFLQYRAIGWVRPDKIPNVRPTSKLKQDWFNFFNSISFGKSEVGNYKVSAGAFVSQQHLERYCLESVKKTRTLLKIEQSKEEA